MRTGRHRIAIMLAGAFAAATVREACAQAGGLEAFNPNVTGIPAFVMAAVPQPDGKIIIGGNFTTVGSTARSGIARLNADGTVDATFNPGSGASDTVFCMALQDDGKILIGGSFTSVNGQARNHIARLLADGSLESTTTFNAAVYDPVFVIAPQPDGKILIGGAFSLVNTQTRNRIARLLSDGSVESTATFNTGTGADSDVYSMAVQPDGKIVLGGFFTAINGQTRNRIARLNSDGSLESTATFNPGTGPDSWVNALALQKDGKILLGGSFLNVNGQARSRIARLNSDGTVESTATFNPGTGADSAIYSIALESSGKPVIGGSFSSFNGQAAGGIIRLFTGGNPEGTGTFNTGAGANSTVYCVALQPDGKILAGGGFDFFNSQSRNHLVRLSNDVPAHTLSIPSASRVQWTRAGSTPEILRSTFELSTNGGSSWTLLGDGTRIAAGWERTGLSLPSSGMIRARGRAAGSYRNGSSAIIELTQSFSGLPAPEIAVEQPAGTNLTDGGTRDFGAVQTGATATLTFTVRNTGTADLTGIAASIDGTNAADFSITATPAATLTPSSTTTVSVRVSPGVIGARAAALYIASNDSDENPFDITLTATGYALPVVATTAVTNITMANATLNGTINANNADASVTFEYGLTTSYGATVSAVPATVTGTTTTVVSAAISGLQPNTTYHYRLRASNAAGIASTTDQTFLTLGPGTVDPGFVPVLGGSAYSVTTTAVQPDGRILVAVPNQIVRVNADGSIDTGFNPGTGAGAVVYAITVQPDGKILVAGQFTTFNGQPRNYLARLSASGALESTATFNPGIGPDGWVYCLAVQPDGKILIGGNFMTVNGQARPFLTRLNADGTLENSATFNPGLGPTAAVNSIDVQPDGKIVIAGNFTGMNGQPWARVARLLPDGSLDTTFNPGTGPNAEVYCALTQTDGKVVIGGLFTSVAGASRNRIARLNADGSVESLATFNPGSGADDSVMSLALQTDGKILAGGNFTSFAGRAGRLVRLNSDGTVESTTAFNPGTGPDFPVFSVGLQSDGGILLGGNFSSVNGQPRGLLARMWNGAAAASLAVPDASTVQWTRSGTAPELSTAVFELSTDAGSHWTTLGTGSRPPGGWQRGGLALPSGGMIRARGSMRGGRYDGSSGLTEETLTYSGLPVPDISVEQPAGTVIASGTTRDFGGVAVGSSASLTFTLNNMGTGALAGVAVSLDGANAADYSLTSTPAGTVAAGGSTTFTVQFLPSAAGVRTAALHIANNDYDESPFDITLTGTGLVPEIVVEQPAGTNLPDAGTRDFGSVVTGASGSLTFIIRNTGLANLTGIAITKDGANSSEFTVTAAPMATVAPAGSTTFIVQFAPAALGARTAALHIANNDSDENPFDITVTGTGIAVPTVTTLAATNVLSTTATLNGSVNPNASSTTATFEYGTSVSYGATVTATPPAGSGTSAVSVSAALTNLIPETVYHFRVSAANEAGSAAGSDFTFTTPPLPPGTLDSTFNSVITASDGAVVRAVAVQPDGKILIGGHFTSAGGLLRNNIARLNPDGSGDATFDPGSGTDYSVECIAIQSDGRILIGGGFTQVNGQAHSLIARLSAGGAVEPANVFTAPTLTGNTAYCIAPQPDGRILVGGTFSYSDVNLFTRHALARLMPNGSLDSDFYPLVQNGGQVHTIALQADGKILIGGQFTQINASTWNRIARLYPSGGLEFSNMFNAGGANNLVESLVVQPDGKCLAGGWFTVLYEHSFGRIARISATEYEQGAAFNTGTGANGLVQSIALQADGKIILAGGFTNFNVQYFRPSLARLQADGTLEQAPAFYTSATAALPILATAQQPDGRILVAGYFTEFDGQPRTCLARLINGPASESLSVPNAGLVRWLRSGAAPEVSQVAFELSTNGGSTWTPLGAGARTAGGWENSAASLPGSGIVRATGRTSSGALNGSSGVVRLSQAFAGLPVPEIAVEQPAGTDISSGTTVDFGAVNDGGSASLVFTVKNSGAANLAISGISFTGNNTSSFSVTSNPAASVAPGGSTTFTVQFAPVSYGPRSAVLHITNSDYDEGSFDITLTGTAIASEIVVEQPVGTAILDGGACGFGNVSLGSNASLTFTVTNPGNINLTGLGITVDGANASEFTVTSSPVAPVAPGGSTAFTVRFTPGSFGAKSAALHISNNDPDENPFDIAITGTGAGAEIAVEEPVNVNVADGATKDFGSVRIQKCVEKTFTVRNSGNIALTGLGVVIDGPNAADFSVVTPPVAPVATNGTTSFTVHFMPAATGAKSAALHLASNDADENPFDIALTGTGTAPAFNSTYDLRKLPGCEPDAVDVLAYGSFNSDAGYVVKGDDINGDGIADFIVGATTASAGSPVRTNCGAIYIWFGKASLAGSKDAAGVAGSAPDVTIIGASADDRLGYAILTADVNGDGTADIIATALRGAGPSDSRPLAGEAYVIFGRKSPAVFPALMDLATQGDTGANVVIYGSRGGDLLGASDGMCAGDLNGDGTTDLILECQGADGPGNSRTDAGGAYIIFGRKAPAVFPATLDLANPGAGGAGVTIYGPQRPSVSYTSSPTIATGDLNGDGTDDLVVGFPEADGPPGAGRSLAGRCCVIFGKTSPAFPAALDMEVQGNGGADLMIYGPATNAALAKYGKALFADVNGDGTVDLAMGSNGIGNGMVSVVFGRKSPAVFPATLDLAVQGTAGADVTIFGKVGDGLGYPLAAGDVNGDGTPDLLMGARSADFAGARTNCGRMCIVFGRQSPTLFPAVMDMAASGNTGPNVVIYGASAEDNFPITGITSADLNGDGFADIIAGTWGGDGMDDAIFNSENGEAYIFFGRPSSAFPAVMDAGIHGNNGANVTIYGATADDLLTDGPDIHGAIACADVNGDGLKDLLLGAETADAPPPGSAPDWGQAYVLFGISSGPLISEIAVEEPAGTNITSGGSDGFGSVRVARCLEKTFSIRNTGTASLSGIGVTIDGPNASNFSIDVFPAATVAPGGSTSFTVHFQPVTTGAKSAALHIASNDADENPFDIALTGTGTPPAFNPTYDLAKRPGCPADAVDVLAYGTPNSVLGDITRAGDLNGDGIADIIAGAPGASAGNPARTGCGAIYVWFGKSNLAGIKDAAGANGSAPDVTIIGAATGEGLTHYGAVAVGDVNGDGVDDLLTAAPYADGPSETRGEAGEVYIVFGRRSPAVFPAVIDLATQGSDGPDVILYGASTGDQLGDFTNLGTADVNGDGTLDVIVGAPLADGPGETRAYCGEMYVVFGRKAPSFFPATLDLAIQGSGGADLTIYGSESNASMSSGVHSADLNGDGVSDLILGSRSASGPAGAGRSQAGRCHIVFGRKQPSAFPVTLDMALQGTSGANVTLYGAGANSFLGGRIASGDVNGDGTADLFVSAADQPGGTACVVFGRKSPSVFPATLDVALQGVGGADVTLLGDSGEASVVGAGVTTADVNGDGVADLLMSEAHADYPSAPRDRSGRLCIVFGRKSPATFPLTLNTAVSGGTGADVIAYGGSADDEFALAVATADVNGDGFTDIIASAELADGFAADPNFDCGEVYIIFGRPSASFPAVLDMALNGNNGANVVIYGATQYDTLFDVAAGDVNGDGVADVLFGSSFAAGPVSGGPNTGQAYVLFGIPSGTTNVTPLADWRTFYFGSSANSGAGADLNDYDGDGLQNLIEYGFGLNPTNASSSQLPAWQQSSDEWVITFTAPAGVSGITYGAECSPALSQGGWTSIPDTGTAPQHIFRVNTTGVGRLFVRLVVTSP